MTLSPMILFFAGWAVMAAVMAALWLYCVRRNNAGYVDIAWSYGFGFLAIFYGLFSGVDAERALLICGAVCLWSFRLGTYVLLRVLREEEDGRYTSIKKKWGEKAGLKLFGFFQLQALADALLSIPLLIALVYGGPGIDVWVWLGVAVILLSVAGESLADWQLSRFKKRPDSKGKTCREGLWRYSRHPNYFFEWVHWLAYPLFAVGAGWLWLASWLSAALMLFFILKLSGIPPTEQQALKSRGDDYRRYQRETSAFIPLPPKTT